MRSKAAATSSPNLTRESSMRLAVRLNCFVSCRHRACHSSSERIAVSPCTQLLTEQFECPLCLAPRMSDRGATANGAKVCHQASASTAPGLHYATIYTYHKRPDCSVTPFEVHRAFTYMITNASTNIPSGTLSFAISLLPIAHLCEALLRADSQSWIWTTC